jgi:hypothetical protein
METFLSYTVVKETTMYSQRSDLLK